MTVHRKISINWRKIQRNEISWAGRTEDESQIGAGGTADVYKVIFDGIMAAWKRFHTVQNIRRREDNDGIVTEAKLLIRINHPNVAKLLAILVPPELGLVLELGEGGSLSKFLQHLDFIGTPVSIRKHVDWALQISSAMEYISSKKIVHRDLKTDNIVIKQPVYVCSAGTHFKCDCVSKAVTSGLMLKITDFGLAIDRFNEKQVIEGDVPKGTPASNAPEVTRHQIYSEASDVWSFGVLLWEIFTKKQAYQERGLPAAVAFSVARNGCTLDTGGLPLKWRWIMLQCQKFTAPERPKFEQIVRFLTDYKRYLTDDLYANEETPKICDVPPPDRKKFIKRKVVVGPPENPRLKLRVSRITGTDLLNFSLPSVAEDLQEMQLNRRKMYNSLPEIYVYGAPSPIHTRTKNQNRFSNHSYGRPFDATRGPLRKMTSDRTSFAYSLLKRNYYQTPDFHDKDGIYSDLISLSSRSAYGIEFPVPKVPPVDTIPSPPRIEGLIK